MEQLVETSTPMAVQESVSAYETVEPTQSARELEITAANT